MFKDKPSLEERILQAAAKEIAQKGFYRANIREIAKEAGTSDSGVYYIFKSKEEILAGILQYGWGEILTRVKRMVIGISDPIEMMKVLFESVAKYLLVEEPEIGAVMLIDGRKEWGIEEKLITAEQREVFEIMEKIIEEAQRRGIYDTGFNIEAARQGLFGSGEDLVLGLYLRPRTDYKANYTFEDAAKICAKMQGAFFTVRKSIEEFRKEPNKKEELINAIAEDDNLFKRIAKRRKQRKSKNEEY